MTKGKHVTMQPTKPQRFMLKPERPARVCSACGFKDSSPVPPVMCPQCHFQDDSPLAQARPPGNRKERRAHEAKMRLQMRKTQKQILRESGGKYEAS